MFAAVAHAQDAVDLVQTKRANQSLQQTSYSVEDLTTQSMCREENDSPIIRLAYTNGVICGDDACSDHYDLLDNVEKLGAQITHFAIWGLPKPPQQTNFYMDLMARGHSLESHTFSHQVLSDMSQRAAMADVLKAETAFAELLERGGHQSAKRMLHISPPSLATTPRLERWLHKRGVSIWNPDRRTGVLWDSKEPCCGNEVGMDALMPLVPTSSGADFMIFMHDTKENRLATPTLIRTIRRKCPDCVFKTVEACRKPTRPRFAERPVLVQWQAADGENEERDYFDDADDHAEKAASAVRQAIPFAKDIRASRLAGRRVAERQHQQKDQEVKSEEEQAVDREFDKARTEMNLSNRRWNDRGRT